MAISELTASTHSSESGRVGNYLSFRTMVSPVLIRIGYVIGALAITIVSLPLMFHGSDSSIYGTGTSGTTYLFYGLGLLTVGNLVWRVLCEQAIVFFNIHERLRSMEHSLTSGAPALSSLSAVSGEATVR